ncbi:hypothetical protein [Streptomyces sp. NPDC051909]|uniref:hypothetical protein n=1 Tax=Streptomyces sp. NPDC051909 TaxID=3154944 RepID=UPI00342D10BE
MDQRTSRPEAEAEPRRRGWRPFLAAIAAACVVAAGGLGWLFWDDMMYPVGDPRACPGSDTALPGVITAAGADLPSDASEVRYYTHEGQVVVWFVSDQVPDYLVRAKLIPDTAPPLLDDERGGKYGIGDGEPEPTEGLCGEPVRGPLWLLGAPGASGGSVLVECSTGDRSTLRTPTRVQVTFRLPAVDG